MIIQGMSGVISTRYIVLDFQLECQFFHVEKGRMAVRNDEKGCKK